MRTHRALCFAVLVVVVSVANASLVDGIIDAITNAATCATCHTLFVPLKGLAALGDKPFTDSFKVICKALNVRAAVLTVRAQLISLRTYAGCGR